MAAFRLQKVRLGRGFNPFGNDLKSEIAPHDDDRTHNRRILGGELRTDLLDETSVYLYSRQRIASEAAERCEAGTEVVECNTYALSSQLLQR